MPINFAVKLVATVALEAMQMGIQALSHTQGPRPTELQVSTAEYGTGLPRFKGQRKFACPIIWAKDLEVVEHSSKIKGGGKQTTYGTLGTFAVAIADCPQEIGPIEKVLKIWMDETLVYDVTGTGPVSAASTIGVDINDVMRIYLGSTDQIPDPAYEAYCQEKYGSSDAPAFREVAHLVFDQLPCDNFGNRVPTVAVLAVTSSAGYFPYETHATSLNSSSAVWSFSPSGQWAVRSTSNGLDEWWDVASRTKLGLSTSAGWAAGSGTPAAVASDGTAYQAGFSLSTLNKELAVTPPLGTPVITEMDAPTISFRLTRVLEYAGVKYVYTAYDSAAGYSLAATHITHTQSARDFCLKSDGTKWGLFQPTGSSSDFTIEDLDTPSNSFTVTGTSRSGPTSAFIQYVDSADHFFVITDGHWYTIDANDGSTKDSGTFSETPQFDEGNPFATTFWTLSTNFKEYSLTDGSLIRSIAKSNWSGSPSSDAALAFEPVTKAVWSLQSSTSNIVIRFIDRSQPAGVMLRDIVSAQCDGCGMISYDASLLTQIVDGFSWTRSDGKSQMQPLLDIHDIDARPHGFTIEFLPRGTAASGLILTEDFAKGEPWSKVTIKQDTDLPKIVRVNFADINNDQEPNNVLSPLTADTVDSQRDETIDLSTYAADPDTAQQLSDRYIRRQWNSTVGIEVALTGQQLALEPGDVTTLSLDGVLQTAKLDKQTFVYSSDTIQCTFIRDETNVAALNSNTTGPPLVRDPDTILIPAPVYGFVIDAPLRQDSDSDTRPLIYDAAGTYAGFTFNGAQVWEQTGTGDAAAYDEFLGSITTAATWGLCSDVLDDVPSPWLWDRGNELTVTLQGGSFSNATEADIDEDPTLNLILVGSSANGWEYINFTTATLVSGSTYTLSGFKRGRRGTEWMCGAHGANEYWVLASSLNPEAMGVDEVGSDASFKVQTVGRILDAAPAIDLDPYTGATLKPYAPARIIWTTDGTDMFGEIIRRTRVGGSWNGGSTIPLSENSEEYEVDIMDGSTVLRTITVSGTNTFTYTGAQISADGNTVGVPPSYNAYQLSDAVGRGYALAA